MDVRKPGEPRLSAGRTRLTGLLLFAAVLGPACTGGAKPTTGTAGAPPSLQGCPHPASTSSQWPPAAQASSFFERFNLDPRYSVRYSLEFAGTSAGGQLWALVASYQKLRARIWWATEGVGSLSVVAEDAAGLRVQPADLGFVQGGVLGWDRPGFQFNSEFRLPHGGCWAMRAIRGPMTGVVWLDLDALARSTVLGTCPRRPCTQIP
jgi:hypothetical protein